MRGLFSLLPWLIFQKGQSGIRVETLLLLAKALDIPAAEILTAMEKALDSAPEQK